MDDNRRDVPKKFNVLYRITRCLDCQEIPLRKDNDCISLMTTASDINDEIKEKIRVLDQKGLGPT
jgi:hypothetical protein